MQTGAVVRVKTHADWRSGKRRGQWTKGSLVRDLPAALFVVALSTSNLPTA